MEGRPCLKSILYLSRCYRLTGASMSDFFVEPVRSPTDFAAEFSTCTIPLNRQPKIRFSYKKRNRGRYL